jgi:general stress protein YciG
MSREKRREIASKAGKAAHAKGTAHEWSRAQAREAGRKGVLARARRSRSLAKKRT